MTRDEAKAEATAQWPDGVMCTSGKISGAEGAGIYTDSSGGKWRVMWADDYGIEYFGPLG